MRTPHVMTWLLSLASLGGLTLVAVAQEAAQPIPPDAASTTLPATQPATEPLQAAPLPATPPPAAAVLTDEQGNTIAGLRLSRAGVHAIVRGTLAQVTVTLNFANANDHIVGGELTFPLPPGATVTGYALDVNGTMVDGVAVGKQKANNIFQAESQRRVDPGLAENVAGNAFRTRLYPIAARGSRTVRVKYLTQINCDENGAWLSLPVNWGAAEAGTVTVETPDLGPSTSSGRGPSTGSGRGPQPFKTAVWPQAGSVAFHTPNHGLVLKKDLTETPDAMAVRLPVPPERSIAIERTPRDGAAQVQWDERGTRRAGWSDPAKRFEQFDYCFALTDTPPAPPAGPAPLIESELTARAVRRVAILWDASLVRAQSTQSALRLLDSILNAWGGATGELVVFRDTPQTPVSFDLGAPDGRTKVIDRLARLVYDGGADLGNLPLPKNASGFTAAGAAQAGKDLADYDCLLLFTDGWAGIGPPTMRHADAPVYAFADAARANVALLQRVCRESGGGFVNISRDATDTTREPWSLLSVDFKPDEVADVVPAGPVSVEGLARVTLTGRLLAPRTTVTFNYGYGGHVLYRQPFTLRVADARGGDLVMHFWAQRKIADLSREAGRHEKELTSIGKRFNMVTPYTSLLVLETVNQYVRYKVVPPDEDSELYRQFMAQTGGGLNDDLPMVRQDERENNLDTEFTTWARQVQWWNDPSSLLPPPPAVPSSGPPEQEDRRQASARHAANARQGLELDREAARARRSGDLSAARDLYAQAVMLDPASAAASQGLLETAQALASGTTDESTRGVIERQARRRSDESAAAFQAALHAGDKYLEQNDLVNADFQIEQARLALGGVTAQDRGTRAALNRQLSSLQHRVDAARLTAARNAPAARDAATKELHAQRDQQQKGVVVNTGDSYHRVDYGSGAGLFGGAGAAGGGGGSGGGSAAPAVPLVESVGAVAPLTYNVDLSWRPDMPYLSVMRDAPPDKIYETYLQQRQAFGRCPGFYLDCADVLERAGQRALAVRVATDTTTFQLADAALLRRTAYRLTELGDRDHAIDLFEQILKMRPGEANARRDLALALSERADELVDLPRGNKRRDRNQIAADYGRCLDLLNQVIVSLDWNQEMLLPCLMDANRVIAEAKWLEEEGQIRHVPVPLDPRLIQNLSCDLRMVMTLDNDEFSAWMTVQENGGATATDGPYSTRSGARMYGVHGGSPQEYCLRAAAPGTYGVRILLANRVGLKPTGPCTIRLSATTDFGRGNDKTKTLWVRVTDISKPIDEIGIVTSRNEAPRIIKPYGVQSTETP